MECNGKSSDGLRCNGGAMVVDLDLMDILSKVFFMMDREVGVEILKVYIVTRKNGLFVLRSDGFKVVLSRSDNEFY